MIIMKEKVSIKLPNGNEYIVCPDYWEYAPCPMCTILVTEEEYNKICNALQIHANELPDDLNEDKYEMILDEYYERYMSHNEHTFYFEDTTDDEYIEMFNDEGYYNLEVCKKIAERISHEEKISS